MKKSVKNKVIYSVASGLAVVSLLATPSVSVHALPLEKMEYLIKVMKLKNIDSSSDLKKEIRYLENSDELDSFTPKQKELLKSTLMHAASKKVVNDYSDEMKEEINSKVSASLSNLTTGETKDRTLSDGSEIEVGSVDEEISSDSDGEEGSDGGIKLQSVESGNTTAETKKYGSRRYTAWVKIKSWGIPIATLKLVNHYSVGDYGLRLNTVDAAGTNGFKATSSVEVLKLSMPDRYAKKVGENINGKGEYHIDGYLNAGYTTLTSTIKLETHKKKAKTAYVYQTFKFTYQ